MTPLTRAQIEAAIVWEPGGNSGEMDLDIPALGVRLQLAVGLREDSDSITDSGIQSINDLYLLTADDRSRIVDLLYDDALHARQQVGFHRTIKVERPKPTTWFKRLLWRPETETRFEPIPHDDPAHPCFMKEGRASVLEKVTWLGARVEEFWDTQHRFAVIDCRPAWEDEHGRTIVIRDGLPYVVADYQVDFWTLDDA